MRAIEDKQVSAREKPTTSRSPCTTTTSPRGVITYRSRWPSDSARKPRSKPPGSN